MSHSRKESDPPARPASVADVLDSAADWLDTGDQAIAMLMPLLGEQVPATVEGKQAQADLRMLAAWLREHPGIDDQMYAVIEVIPPQ